MAEERDDGEAVMVTVHGRAGSFEVPCLFDADGWVIRPDERGDEPGDPDPKTC